MHADEIIMLREKTLKSQMTHEIIEVSVYRTTFNGVPLRYKIDDRNVQKTIQTLIAEEKMFSMTNLVTGATFWSDDFKGNLEDLCKTMASPKASGF